VHSDVEILKKKPSRFLLYNVLNLAKFNRVKHRLKSNVTYDAGINILGNFRHIRYALEYVLTKLLICVTRLLSSANLKLQDFIGFEKLALVL
jgi:hypothetical protein